MSHLSHVPFRTVVQFTIGIIVGLLALAFVIFQARYLLIGPWISLTEEPPGLQNERQVFLAGNAKNISRLWLNDRPIFTDATGHFREAVILENGYTIATLKAEDRYGRTVTVEKPMVYVPASFFIQ